MRIESIMKQNNVEHRFSLGFWFWMGNPYIIRINFNVQFVFFMLFILSILLECFAYPFTWTPFKIPNLIQSITISFFLPTLVYSFSRFLIARSCEDICCRKRIIAKKSTSPSDYITNYSNNYRQCEITDPSYNSNVNNLRIKSLVQIFSTNGKKFVCLGSLVHPKAVLTTLECVST